MDSVFELIDSVICKKLSKEIKNEMNIYRKFTSNPYVYKEDMHR